VTSIARKPRSEVRVRTKLVAVRFSDAEYAVLSEAAKRTGKGESTLLRETFLKARPGITREDGGP
jgi:hypothetical protein